MSNDLQPCPFCGGTARFNETEDGGHFIECTKCRSSTCLRYSLMDDAKPLLAESWNRRAQLDAAAPGAVQEPVEYQVRTRPMWRDEAEGWTEWRKCSPESYADYVRVPVLHDWQHETRALYAAPVAAAAPGSESQKPPAGGS